MHPMVSDLDDDTLRRQLLQFGNDASNVNLPHRTSGRDVLATQNVEGSRTAVLQAIWRLPWFIVGFHNA